VRLQHVANHLAAEAAAGGADPGHDLAVVGVGAKGEADDLMIPAGDLVLCINCVCQAV
jgi:hypothetical protein